MEQTAKDLYQTWIDLYDQAAPDEAMKLTAPDFVMVTPDGRSLARAEATEFVGQIKAYIQQTGLRRKTTLKSFHTSAAGAGTLIYATVDLAFTSPAGETNTMPFVEIMQIGADGITFDAFARLADSQSFF